MVSSMSRPRAFEFGMALFPVQIKNLAIFVVCLNLIAAPSLSPRSSAVALGLVLVVLAIPVLELIVLYAAVPQRTSEMLGSLRTWLEKSSYANTLVLCALHVRSVLPPSEASGDRETRSSRWRPVMATLTRNILKSVGPVAPLITAYLPLLSPHVYGKEATRETSLSNYFGSGDSHTPGAVGG